MSATAGPSTVGYAPRALTMMAGFADREAVVDGQRRFTYRGLHGRILGMADGLWQHGVRPGQTVGVLALNPAESLFLQFAVHLLGCRSAWVAPSAPPAFRHDFLRLAGIDAFVYDANRVPELGAELADASAVRAVFRFGPAGRDVELAGECWPETLHFDPAQTARPAGSLFQTGGTTGTPKLVHHGPAYFEALYRLSVHYGRSGAPRLRHLLHSGTWHASAQVAAYMTLLSGGTLHLQEGLEIGQFLHTIEAERINSTLVMPGQLYALLDDPRLATADLGSLQTLSVSGAPVAPTRLAEAVRRLGPIIRVVYGMSECPMITAATGVRVDPARPELLASCGSAYGDIRLQIREPDGTVLPTGAVGEIWVSGSLMMSEYFGARELTAEALADGWLRTGDIGRLDDKGRLYIVDRAKDMIITGTGAVNVYSRMVEDVLLSHPEVRAAAVVGAPDDSVGEAVHAFVVPAAGTGLTADEVRAHALTQLSPIWAPKVVHFLDALPLTGSGKVDKKRLRATLAPASAGPAAVERLPGAAPTGSAAVERLPGAAPTGSAAMDPVG
jgi:fatty-acyl-CoA synthase